VSEARSEARTVERVGAFTLLAVAVQVFPAGAFTLLAVAVQVFPAGAFTLWRWLSRDIQSLHPRSLRRLIDVVGAERAVFGADPGDGGGVETALPAVGGGEAGREFGPAEPTAQRVVGHATT